MFGLTQNNADDITTNLQGIAQNAADISQNLTLINNNAADILGVFNITQTNAGNISSNVTDIQTNATNIAINAGDLQAFNGIFPNGILNVANGGTGVGTKTGSGSVVGQTGPTISGAYMTGSSFCDTPSGSDNSNKLVNSLWVNAQDYGDCFIVATNNSSGFYFALRWAGANWRVTQWSRRLMVVDPGTTCYWPVAFSGIDDYDMNMTSYVAGQSGLNTAPGIKQRATNFHRTIAPSYQCGYVGVGLVSFAGFFADTGDRYYNKVLRTEHVQEMHGDWTLDPDVVILPPGNTFWGTVLDVDEELTYDMLALPNGRVPRIILANELIGPLLRAADLTQGRLSRALLADSRGLPADLVAFNSDLDILVAAHPYTEAQFLENI